MDQTSTKVDSDHQQASNSNKKPIQPPKCYVKTATNHTFSPQTIVPIIRNVKINDYCYAIYSTLHKIPLAVHQFLDKSIVEGTGIRDGKNFNQQVEDVDPEDLKFYADGTYYEKTGAAKNMKYDKGHMAPAKNYCGQQSLIDSTYTYANCVPQNSYFNRGSWKNLESYARNFVRKDMSETLQVISGPIFYSGVPHYKGYQNMFENHQVVLMENGIVVPPKCFKIIKANVGNKSYASAFVFQNKYVKDNDQTLKSHVVDFDQLEMMTGLRFNIGKCNPLEELDPVGMAKTMGQLHLQFYTKLFMAAKFLSEMNGARKQGFSYYVEVDIKCVPDEEKLKIAFNDFQNTMQEKGWTRSKARCRRKINTLLSLHKDAKELGILTEELKAKIEKGILDNIEGAKTEDDKQYYRYISLKLYKENGYPYPFEEELKKIFANIAEKEEGEQKEGQNQNTESQSQNLLDPKDEEQSNSKTVKKSKYTPKKEKKEGSAQKVEESQGSSAKKSKKAAKKFEPKPQTSQQAKKPEQISIDNLVQEFQKIQISKPQDK